MAQNRVKLPTPDSSKASNSTSPNEAQKRDCDVSNRLEEEEEEGTTVLATHHSRDTPHGR